MRRAIGWHFFPSISLTLIWSNHEISHLTSLPVLTFIDFALVLLLSHSHFSPMSQSVLRGKLARDSVRTIFSNFRITCCFKTPLAVKKLAKRVFEENKIQEHV